MIKTDIYEQVLFETVKRGATEISADVKEAFEAAIARESNPDAQKGLIATLNSMEMSAKRENPLCVDTGWPIFYFKVGNQCVLEGGFVELENAARRAVAKATELGYLRATMKHPLTGYDPGNNIGMNIPDFTYQFVDGDSIEISYAADVQYEVDEGATRISVKCMEALPDYSTDEKKQYAISGLFQGYFFQLNDLVEEYYDFLEVEEVDE